MKIFESNGKINFVDDNNVFVGFDYRQDCCEQFGYLITKKKGPFKEHIQDIEDLSPLKEDELSKYDFDTKFFKEEWCPYDDGGGSVSFCLLPKKGTDLKKLYLTLYNHHNGYYGHGFEATIGGINWQEGTL